MIPTDSEVTVGGFYRLRLPIKATTGLTRLASPRRMKAGWEQVPRQANGAYTVSQIAAANIAGVGGRLEPSFLI
jgi:hypothetical protein